MSAWVCRPHGQRDHAYCRAFNDPLAPGAVPDLARWTTVVDPAFNPWPLNEMPAYGSDVPWPGNSLPYR